MDELKQGPIVEFLTTAQVAELLQCSEASLKAWRRTGQGPRARKLGSRSIRYVRSEVIAYVLRQLIAA